MEASLNAPHQNAVDIFRSPAIYLARTKPMPDQEETKRNPVGTQEEQRRIVGKHQASTRGIPVIFAQG